MLKVTVVRRLWNGNTLARVLDSKLYVASSNLMCCLGFAGLAAGLSKQDMEGLGYVHQVGGSA